MASAGGCLRTVQGLGMCCRRHRLLLEPKHHATSHAHPDDHHPLRLMWRIPFPHNCHPKAIDRQVLLRQVHLGQCYQQRAAPHTVFMADIVRKCPSPSNPSCFFAVAERGAVVRILAAVRRLARFVSIVAAGEPKYYCNSNQTNKPSFRLATCGSQWKIKIAVMWNQVLIFLSQLKGLV